MVLFVFCEISGQALVWETTNSSNNTYGTIIAVLFSKKEQQVFLQDVPTHYSSGENISNLLRINLFIRILFIQQTVQYFHIFLCPFNK